MKEKLNNLRVLIFILIFNFLGGYISSLLSGDQKLVYNSLEKPWFSPPSIVFPIVWSILYFLLAVAIFLNYKKDGKDFLIYFISMFINFSWSYIFFAQRLYGIGFLIIIVLIVLCVYLGIRFLKNSKIASLIMLIYLLWLSYAGLLNYFIWVYNEM